MLRPFFTVIIPTRNRAAFARRAVACVLTQEDVDVEVLLVDDGSTDGSFEDLRTLDDPRVRLLQGPGAGPCAARNQALPRVNAPWIAFLDDDDLWAPGKLRTVAERAGTAAFCFSSAFVTDEHGLPLRVDPAPVAVDLERQLLARNVIGTPSVVAVRTDAVVELNGFDERVPVLGDWELWLRLAAIGPGVRIVEPLTAYTVHSRAISVREAGALETELRHLRQKHDPAYRRTGVRLDMDWFTQWNAENLLRRGDRLAATRSFLRQGVVGRSGRSMLRAGRLLVGERLSSRLRPPAPPPERPAWLGSYYPAKTAA